MSDSDLSYVFELMGSKLTGGGSNKSAKCPLAPWTHARGVDKNPSVTAKAGDPCVFKCWSCLEAGLVRSLAKKYGDFSGDYSALNYLKQIEGETVNAWGGVERSKYGDYYRRLNKASQPKVKPTSEEELKVFLKKIPKYAFDRGLTKEEVDLYEIGYDEKQKRMIIPVRDKGGVLLGVSGRDVTGERNPKYKHYPGLQKEKVWYGERWLDTSFNSAYIVEGFWDVWTLRRFGLKNVLASMGTSISIDQIKRLIRFAASVVIVPDFDDQGEGFGPGLRFAEESALRLTQHGLIAWIAGVKINNAFMPSSDDGKRKKWEKSDYRTMPIAEMVGKDPGDITEDLLKKVLSNRCSFKFEKGVLTVE